MEVTRETVLPAEAQRVWEALTDDEQLSDWFGGDVALDPRPDGEAEFRGPEGVRRARVDRVVPEERLSWRWLDDDEQDEGYVDLVLVPVTGGTRLTVTETPAASPVASVEWSLRLDALACACGAGTGPRPLAAATLAGALV